MFLSRCLNFSLVRSFVFVGFDLFLLGAELLSFCLELDCLVTNLTGKKFL